MAIEIRDTFHIGHLEIEMSAERIIKELSSMSFDNTFNPYRDRCEVFDYFDAPQKRRQILKKMLLAARLVEIDAIWIGRDLGYRGGRRTGLALTDDVHLSHHTKRWSVECGRPTKGSIVPERTAAVIWEVLAQISLPVFLWNVFPLHPYESGAPFTNRTHNAKERVAGEELLAMLIEYLQPKRLIAIGNDAGKAANKYNDRCKVFKVRHPSYGGQNVFLDQIHSLYNIDTVPARNMTLFE